MIFFKLHITMGLFDSKTTYEEMQPHLEDYSFSGLTIPEIAEKVKRTLGDDPSWTETASIDLYYKTTACRGYLNVWNNVGADNKTQLVNLIYGA
jgi:hypothetical protein